MGRTNPTYRNWLTSYETEWASFRRALRADHQANFDRLFDRASEYAGPAGFQNATDPKMALLLSIALSQERELRDLREQLEDE